MNDSSFEHYRSRAERERAAAERAADDRAAQAHRELAEHYDRLGDGTEQPAADAGEASQTGILSAEFRIIP